jgi:hypothetical protein
MANTQIAAQTLATYSAVYINSSGKMAKATAASASMLPIVTLAKASMATNASGEFYQLGDEISNASWSWTSGGLIYASAVTGVLTQILTTVSGHNLNIAGISTATTSMLLWPNFILIEVA